MIVNDDLRMEGRSAGGRTKVVRSWYPTLRNQSAELLTSDYRLPTTDSRCFGMRLREQRTPLLQVSHGMRNQPEVSLDVFGPAHADQRGYQPRAGTRELDGVLRRCSHSQALADELR